ncbi:unnamed protein product [Rotaria sp. Silwood1]|nr:unnamed protein product [Rotaria sp. Silwood1]
MVLSNIGGDINIYILKRINYWACHIRGYLHFVFLNSIYLSYVLQSGFRLLRIVFHKYKYLRTIYSFSFFILVQWIASFLFILPILIGDHNYTSVVVYLPQEFYCSIPITSIRGTIFIILSVYFIPLCCIGVTYLWIIIHVQYRNRQIMLIPISVQRKTKRDNIIIKRICMVMIVLSSLGIIPCSFVIVYIMTNYLHWASYRISWMTVSISFALITLSSLYHDDVDDDDIRFISNIIVNIVESNDIFERSAENIRIEDNELGCFFDKTNITLADGSMRPLNLLTVGEEVLVYLSSGKTQKSRVLTIFHHQRSSVRFLEIYTVNKQEPLRLTPSHSILIKKNTKKQSSFHYSFAHKVAIGDFVFSSELKSLRVINIKEIILYNQTISTPLTFEGNIIVNNLIASCYATYRHKFMHMLTLPLRYWYQIEMFSHFNYFIVHLIDFYSKINF